MFLDYAESFLQLPYENNLSIVIYFKYIYKINIININNVDRRII